MTELRVRDRRFPCRDVLPGVLVMRIGKAYSSKDTMAQIAVGYDVLMAAVLPEHRDALEEFLLETEPPIEVEELSNALGELLREYTGRPTERPSDSAPSSSTNGQPSRVVSLSRDTGPEERPSSRAGASGVY